MKCNMLVHIGQKNIVIRIYIYNANIEIPGRFQSKKLMIYYINLWKAGEQFKNLNM